MPAHGITCEDLESGNDDLEMLAQPAKRRRITGKSRPTLEVSGAMQEHEEPETRTETRTEARQSPFGEFVDQEVSEDFDEPILREEVGSSHERGTQPAPPPPAKKHAAASAKLKLIKRQADQTWQRHLNSSVRIAQLLGTAPIAIDKEAGEVGTARFKVHPSHVLMAVRSIVFCKACGYWASKKSQNLQKLCPKKPPHSDGAFKLTQMLNGLHPDPKIRVWTDGHDARVPSQPIFLDWNQEA